MESSNSLRRRSVSTARKAGGTRHRSQTQRRPSFSSRTVQTRAKDLLIRLSVLAIAAMGAYLVYIYIVSPYSRKWRALYGKENYPEGYSIRGIDISHHQGEIDWQKLASAKIKESQVSFVFIKATEGLSLLDENFNDNFYQAREYGFIRGAYHYFKPNVPASKQAAYYLKQVHLEPGDLPPVLDIEETGNLSKHELQQAALTWLRTVEKRYRVKPILYTGYKFKESYLNAPEFADYPYWIAHYYVPKLSYKGAWKFWQHTDCGRLPGIREKVDLNIYNGSMYDLHRLCLEED